VFRVSYCFLFKWHWSAAAFRVGARAAPFGCVARGWWYQGFIFRLVHALLCFALLCSRDESLRSCFSYSSPFDAGLPVRSRLPLLPARLAARLLLQSINGSATSHKRKRQSRLAMAVYKTLLAFLYCTVGPRPRPPGRVLSIGRERRRPTLFAMKRARGRTARITTVAALQPPRDRPGRPRPPVSCGRAVSKQVGQPARPGPAPARGRGPLPGPRQVLRHAVIAAPRVL
jgi:hypothetical protein